jgi:hypothetical protein
MQKYNNVIQRLDFWRYLDYIEEILDMAWEEVDTLLHIHIAY